MRKKSVPTNPSLAKKGEIRMDENHSQGSFYCDEDARLWRACQPEVPRLRLALPAARDRFHQLASILRGVSMRIPSLTALALLAACSSGTQADTASTPAPAPPPGVAPACPISAGTRVLTADFTSAGERAAVLLEAGCLYYAETDVGGITLQLRPRQSGTQMPYIGQLMSGGVAGGSTWEIRATITGEYQIWVTGAGSGRAVRVTVTSRGPIKANL
jgi:hypothetical protein